MLDHSKVKPYFTMAYPYSSNTLPLSYNTFLLLRPLVTVYFRNDLVTGCFYREQIYRTKAVDLFIYPYLFSFECFLSLGAAT
jgi:hypothetical protein